MIIKTASTAANKLNAAISRITMNSDNNIFCGNVVVNTDGRHVHVSFEIDKEDVIEMYSAIKEEENKKLVFKDFLEEYHIKWEDFRDNCSTENQRWGGKGSYYGDISDLFTKSKKRWVVDAFDWERSKFVWSILLEVNESWVNAVIEAEKNGIEIVCC